MQTARDLGFEPVFLSIVPRIDHMGLLAACLWEIDIPKPRQRVHDDRTIPRGEVTEPTKPSANLEGYRAYLGVGSKK